MRSRSAALNPAQRQVLILCDGQRRYGELCTLVPQPALDAALQQLCGQGLLQAKAPVQSATSEPPPLSEAERFRAMVELATSMAEDLGFASRVKAQLQIEKAQSLQDLAGVVDLLSRSLADQGKKTPLLAQRLARLRQLAGTAQSPAGPAGQSMRQ